MWMMGCKNGGGFSKCDSFHSRRLRPLIPRPTATPSSSSCLGCLHVDEFFALHSHLDQNKRELSATPASSRWNPTPEQLQMLEDWYKRGTRTPTAEQIQRITAMLRRYGKIEGKNVFYWFQNHKARERQKRRRQLESDTLNNVTKDNQVIEVENTKNYASPTKCTAITEESSSNQIPTSNTGINSSKRIHPTLPLNLLQDSCSLQLNLDPHESWYNNIGKQRNYEFDLNIEDFECGESKNTSLIPSLQ